MRKSGETGTGQYFEPIKDLLSSYPITATGLALGLAWLLSELYVSYRKNPLTGRRRGFSLSQALGPAGLLGLSFGTEQQLQKVSPESTVGKAYGWIKEHPALAMGAVLGPLALITYKLLFAPAKTTEEDED
jgi:hypothetical protein